jgi:hypothetical protein
MGEIMPSKEVAAKPATSIDRARRDRARPDDDHDNSVHAASFPAHAKKLGLKPAGKAASAKGGKR